MSDKLIKREHYIKKIEKFLNKPVIKVIIGMRRAGKSSILKLIIKKLLSTGISEKNIVYINKESLEYDFIKNYRDLYNYVKNYLSKSKGQNYILIDEIQEIEEWEKSVNSFLTDNLGDIIITGSNAKIMSKELATLLSGRYVEIPVYPLTFNEFLSFRKKKINNREEEFLTYLRFGGLPGIHHLPFEDEVIFGYLNAILDTVLYKDIIVKNSIRDPKILDKIVRYLFDNIGNIVTAKRISDYFKSQQIRTSVDTVLKYLDFIESAFLVDKVDRYNIKGRKNLEFYYKIYLNDIGLRHGLIGYREMDISQLLENIVYSELKARGYKLRVGIFEDVEIDFIAEKQGEKKYFQVCYLFSDEKVIEREFGNLEKIKDNYDKYVISMDRFFQGERNGIKHKYLLDFLTDYNI